jgi:hypothetical protein
MQIPQEIQTYSDASSDLYAVIPAGIGWKRKLASSFVFPLADPRFLDSTPSARSTLLTFCLLWRYGFGVSVRLQAKDVI